MEIKASHVAHAPAPEIPSDPPRKTSATSTATSKAAAAAAAGHSDSAPAGAGVGVSTHGGKHGGAEEEKVLDSSDDDDDDGDDQGVDVRAEPPRHFEHRQEGLTFSEINAIVKKAQGHDQFRSLFAGDESQEATVRSFLQKVIVLGSVNRELCSGCLFVCWRVGSRVGWPVRVLG